MKRWISQIVLLALFSVGCGNETTVATVQTPTSESFDEPVDFRLDGRCLGIVTPCSHYSSQTACSFGSAGCRWDYRAKECTGFARSCSMMTSKFACSAQRGCYWQPRITANPFG